MKKYSLLLFSIFLVFFIPIASAQTNNCLDALSSYKNSQALINGLPGLNNKLGNCPIDVPSQMSKLAGNGNVQVNIGNSSGALTTFYLTIANSQVTSATSTKPTSTAYMVSMSDATLDTILSSSNQLSEFMSQYANGKVTISGTTIFNKIKIFLAGIFLRKQIKKMAQKQNDYSGKPENCDETYMQGHENYGQNKALWDSYSADTDGVCQSITGKGIPTPCEHSVQLSKGGIPYYICWYKNS